MMLKIITNHRKLELNTKNMKMQNRGGIGANIFNVIGKKIRQNEEILSIEE